MTLGELREKTRLLPDDVELWLITDVRARINKAEFQTLKDADPGDIHCSAPDEPRFAVLVLEE